MKKSLFTLLLIVSVFLSHAQRVQRCDVPLSDHEFRQKQKLVADQPTEERKLQVAKAVATNNCLTVEQVKAFATLFNDDGNRLDFAKVAWNTTFDKENFYFVYDDFAYFSTVFMLHDYIKSMEGNKKEDPDLHVRPVNLNFPPLDYPAFDNYHGPTNCNTPMREDEFMRVAREVDSRNSEAENMLILTHITQNNCLSVSQTMKLASMIPSESNRLSFFKTAYMSIFDLKNLPAGAQLFKQDQNKSAYLDFISRQLPPPAPVMPPPCRVDAEDFNHIKATISKESFNTTKLTLARQIIRSKQCFTVRQISELLRLISFEVSRLDLAKFAYDYTIDREDYYKVADVFDFSKSKEELMKFLETKK